VYCKYCGKKLDDGVSFCTGCGKPIQKQPEKKEQEKPEKIKKTNHPQKKRTPKKSVRVIVIGAVAVLALSVAAVWGGYKIYTEKNGTDKLEDSMSADAKRIEALAEEEARAKDEWAAKVMAEEEAKEKEESKENTAAEEDTWTDPETGLTRIRGGHTNKKYGYVNEEGEEIIPPFYDRVSEPGENGLILAEQLVPSAFAENLTIPTYFYTEKGEKVYDYVRGFGEHQSAAAREGTEYFIVNRQGSRISENSYTYIGEADIYGNFIVTQGASLGLVNAEGKEIIKPQDIRIIPIDRLY